MHYASLGPCSTAAFRPAPPVTRFIHAMRAMAQDGSAEGGETGLSSPPSGRNGGRGLMRRMLIAAAIAGGLVALWVALLPLAA